MSCEHVCEDCLEQKQKIAGLVMKLESYLSLLRYRHIPKATPDDIVREIDQALSSAHGFAKSGRMA